MKRNVIAVLIGGLIGTLIAVALMSAYVYVDTISITAPPWDYCGFNETKAGTAFTCIQFDTDVITFK